MRDLRIAAFFLALPLLVISACERQEKPGPGPLEKAGRKADDALDKASVEAKEAAEKARKNLEIARATATVEGRKLTDKMERVGEQVGQGAKKVGDVVRETAGNVKDEAQRGNPTPVPTRTHRERT